MSKKVNDESFCYDKDIQSPPPNVSWSDTNEEVGMKKDESEFYKEEKKEVNVDPGAEASGSQAQAPPNNPQRHSWILATIRPPGAQRVDGFGNRGIENDDEQMTVVSREESIIPISAEAELINIEEDERRRQDEITQAIQNDRQQAVVGEVISDRGRRWKLARAFLVVILVLIVIGVVLGITLRKDPESALVVPTFAPTPPLQSL
jgi:predicted nucleic acid-binding Zn ribbon protein